MSYEDLKDPEYRRLATRMCSCLGPQRGETLCPCKLEMQRYHQRKRPQLSDDEWIENERKWLKSQL